MFCDQGYSHLHRTKEKGKKDDIVMEMKTDKTEETVLLQGVNGDKKSLDQVTRAISERYM